MASVKFSAIVSNIRGKLNGSYFSAGLGGTQLKTVPKTGQRRPRGKGGMAKEDSGRVVPSVGFGFTSSQWAPLSNEHKNAWNSAAGGLTWYNKAGEPYTPSGFAYFCSVNNRRITTEQAPRVTPMVDTSDVDMGLHSIEWSSTVPLTYSYNGTAPANCTIAIFATTPQSLGVKNPKGGYKLIFSASTLDIGPDVLTDEYLSVFGYTPTKGRVFFNIVCNTKDGGNLVGNRLITQKIDA